MNTVEHSESRDRQVARSLLLMTTKNRYHGTPETTLLSYRRDGDDYIVAARNETEHYKPEWYLNLKEEPVVELEINGVSFHAKASTPVGARRLEIWPLAESLADTSKLIPRDTTVVLLSPLF